MAAARPDRGQWPPFATVGMVQVRDPPWWVSGPGVRPARCPPLSPPAGGVRPPSGGQTEVQAWEGPLLGEGDPKSAALALTGSAHSSSAAGSRAAAPTGSHRGGPSPSAPVCGWESGKVDHEIASEAPLLSPASHCCRCLSVPTSGPQTLTVRIPG